MSESGDDGQRSAAEPAKPLLTIVRGNPTDAEVAAVVAVISAAAANAGTEPAGPATPNWSRPAGMHRRPMPQAGPSAWVQAGRNR